LHAFIYSINTMVTVSVWNMNEVMLKLATMVIHIGEHYGWEMHEKNVK